MHRVYALVEPINDHLGTKASVQRAELHPGVEQEEGVETIEGKMYSFSD